MTIRTLSVLAGLLLTTSVASAQQDPKAGKILDEMSAKYKSLKAFKASFQQTLENPLNKIKETMEGDITVSGSKFRLQTKGQEVVNDGKTMWTFMKAENEVNISDYDPDEEEISPTQIFTLYQKGYKYTYVEQMTENGIAYDVVELAPEDRSNSLIKVRLQVSKKDRSVKSWKMFKKNGNRYSFVIKNFMPNPPVTVSTFAFDKAKHKGVKVIDLR
ncbi:MAG: outer membrane lipoprotein carrier protein LolA [Hymenobacteraceae bacterium]|nr:outer membrane lipoprotein carrier protein LolA [Hymenobacteraceae bacterium]